MRNNALENFKNAQDVWINHHQPYLMKHSAVSANWSSINGVAIPDLAFTIDKKAFVNNRDYSNIIALRMRMMGNFTDSLLEINDFLKTLANDINKHLKKAK